MLILNHETIDLARQILMDGFDGKFPAFDKCFEPSEEVIPKHLLYEAYRDKTDCRVPKVFLYIVMNELYGEPVEKAASGHLGYRLKLSL